MEQLQRYAFMLRSSFWRKVAYEPGRTPTPEFLSCVHAVRGGVNQVLWVEQFWNGHLRKLGREMFEDCPSAKIEPLYVKLQIQGLERNLYQLCHVASKIIFVWHGLTAGDRHAVMQVIGTKGKQNYLSVGDHRCFWLATVFVVFCVSS